MREGWIETTLGEIADVIGGGTPSTSVPEYWGNEFIWLTPTEIVAIDGKTVRDSIRKLSREGLANSGAQILPSGSVILTSRASVGYVAISECELSTNQGFQSLVPKEKVLAYFLMYWIQNNRNEFESRAAGSTFKEISKTNVKSIKLYLPPIPEQKRIVDLISTIDSYIEALEQQAESARKSRSAVLHEKLSAGGDGWTKTTLKEVVAFSIGGVWGDEVGQSEFDVAVYRQTEFTDSGVLKTPADAIRSIKKSQLQSRALKYGDILIQKSAGTPTLPGRVVMIEKIPEDTAVFSNFLNLIRADATKCLPQYLFILLWLKHKNGIAFEYQRGTNIRNLDLQNYLHESINLPPLLEQKRIVDLISSMDHGISLTEKLISETKMLRSGLLSNLLSGEHEIPESYDKVIGAA